jgi:lauroyl/myristoyl acyltransferase
MDRARRSVTHTTVSGLLAASRALPSPVTRLMGGMIGILAGSTIPLRHRLYRNLELALGQDAVPNAAVRRYFQRLGLLLELQARVYHRGLAATDLSEFVDFDGSIDQLDAAVQEKRGAILAAPHLFGHELGAGLINARHRVVAIVRESSDRRKQLLKERWYQALGIATLCRPRNATAMWDLQSCLAVLQEGAVLGLTPDLLVSASDGVPISIFGRTAHVRPGLAALAMYSGAPVISCFNSERDDGRRIMTFTPPEYFERPPAGRRKTPAQTTSDSMRLVMQIWFGRFESYLRSRPHEWLFWLDKSWTKLIRTPQVEGTPLT